MKRLFLSLSLNLLFLVGSAQTHVVEFLKAGKADAKLLFQAYLQPYAVALGDGLNNSWYHSAQTHKLFGFDFSVALSGIQIPVSATTFDINSLGLTNTTVESGGSIAPTVAGVNQPGPKLVIKDNGGNSLISFNSPNGTGLDLVPVPMAQMGFGLLPHTDVIGRFVPEMTYNNRVDPIKIGYWGLGVKHNFTKWFPVLRNLPFDASVFGSYSEVNTRSALNFTPHDYGGSPEISVTFVNTGDQYLKIRTRTTKVGLVVSKKLGILTLFGGIGQSTSESTIDLVGKYPVITKASGPGYEITEEDALVDPIALYFKSNKISMDAGLRLKLAIFGIFGSIDEAQYTSYNVGISLGVR
jgi:hypothetical protein